MFGLLDKCHYDFFTIVEVHLFPFMWPYGNHFCMQDVDDGCVLQDYGVEFEFDQSSCVRHHDQNLMQGTLSYS